MNKIILYIKDVRAEMKHVTWPTRRQAVAFTVAVLIISAGIAYYLGALDYGFSLGLERLLTR